MSADETEQFVREKEFTLSSHDTYSWKVNRYYTQDGHTRRDCIAGINHNASGVFSAYVSSSYAYGENKLIGTYPTLCLALDDVIKIHRMME